MPPAAVPPLLGRALAALAVAGVVLFAGIGPVAAQDPALTTVPPTSGVLVPGSVPPTTAGPATTTTTTEAPAADDGGFLGLDLDANEKVWVIVGGLVALAVVLLILTIVYWRHTRPTAAGGDRRSARADRREDKAARKDEKRQRRRAERDPFTEEPAAAAGAEAEAAGPMDLDDLLGTPDPSRSVFGQPTDPDDPGR